jgi:hypothetical protein
VIEINPTRWREPAPLAHQIIGVKKMVRDPYTALWDETGTAKTRQVIDTACELYEADEIDTVLIVCPAGSKSVWSDTELGQLIKYVWVKSWVTEYDSRTKELCFADPGLDFIVTSYEFIRSEANLKPLLKQLRKRKIFIAADESWMIENHKAVQTKALYALGEISKYRVCLNGTPTTHWLRAPIKYFSQFYFLNPDILGKNYFAYRNRYCVMGGFKGKNIVGAQNVDELNQKMAPHILRRLKTECFDLPDKLYTQIEVPLSAESWRLYSEMRDDLVTYLNNEEVCSVTVAAVKGIRLAQITSGFLGGVTQVAPEFCGEGGELNAPDLDLNYETIDFIKTKEIGSEKQSALIRHFLNLGIERMLIWARFRAEIDRLYEFAKASSDFKGFKVHRIYAQPKAERHAAKVEAEIGTGPCIIIANPKAGGMALQMTTFGYSTYLSQDFSLKDRKQSEDRTHRLGQLNKCTYCDLIATGPKGQKTIDHRIVKALRAGEDLATWTTAEWRKALAAEEL